MKVVNLRTAPYTVYIGRGSALGNLFTHLPLVRTKALVQVGTVEEAVDCFERWARGDAQWDDVIPPAQRERLIAAVRALRSSDVLGCYCAPGAPCHGLVVVKLWKELGKRSKPIAIRTLN